MGFGRWRQQVHRVIHFGCSQPTMRYRLFFACRDVVREPGLRHSRNSSKKRRSAEQFSVRYRFLVPTGNAIAVYQFPMGGSLEIAMFHDKAAVRIERL